MTSTSFDCPGSQLTAARGINDRGDIVGNCEDDNGTGRHGFLLRKGIFTIIDVPDAQLTDGAAINNRGDVVGQYVGSDDTFHGFLLRKGHFTTIDPPGSRLTSARGIDDKGRIVGAYLGSDEVFRGFILESNGYRDIEFPEAVSTGAFGINARSEIVGGYYDADLVPHGFLLKDGVFTSIDPPGAMGCPSVWDQRARSNCRRVERRWRMQRLLCLRIFGRIPAHNERVQKPRVSKCARNFSSWDQRRRPDRGPLCRGRRSLTWVPFASV